MWFENLLGPCGYTSRKHGSRAASGVPMGKAVESRDHAVVCKSMA